MAFALAFPLLSTSAFALSEIKTGENPPPDGTSEQPQPPSPIPLPGAVTVEPETSVPDGEAEQPASPGHINKDENRPTPEILYDTELLPVPAQRMRELIIEACKTGDIEALRPLIGVGADITQLAFGGIEDDPINYLRQLSGDEGGQEILAILLEIMESGFVKVSEGDTGDMYVWPYFFAVPIESLNPQQRVELFKVVTAGDYEDMRAYGSYIFYRSAISPEGRWIFFLAGD